MALTNFTGLHINTKEPVYIQIARYVKRMILCDQIKDTEKLPSRRELAMTLGVNPNTVQKAFKLMEEEGYVLTEGNSASKIRIDPDIYRKIEEEMTHGLVKEFVQEAKRNNLSFQKVVALLSDIWDSA